MKTAFSRGGQSIIEYVLIFAVILFAVLNARFIDKARDLFANYFESTVDVIAPLP